MAYQVSKPPKVVSLNDNLLDTPRHPVTEDMWKKSRARAGQPAPLFVLQDHMGDKLQLTELLKKGPVVLVFTKDGCPCSMESQPFFNQLARHFAGKATFVGVIDAPQHVASKYKDDFSVPYTMALAADGAVFKSFGSLQSVYTTLIKADGIVAKQWPGYSRATLTDLNEELATLTQIKPGVIDLTMAPSQITSGCFFR